MDYRLQVNADLSKPASLSKHMLGVSAVYIISPGAENRVELVAAGIAAAKAANVPHVVVVSVPSIEADGDLCFKGHFSQIEESAKASGLPFTLLRLPMFFENQWANQGSIKGQGKIYGPADPSKPVTLVGVSDIAAASAAVLVDPESHVNKTYTLASDTTTFGKIAAGFASATGNDCDYVQVPYPAALEAMVGLGFPEWQAKGVCELLRLVDSESPAAVNDTADLTKLLGGPPTTFEKWVASVAGGFK